MVHRDVDLRGQLRHKNRLRALLSVLLPYNTTVLPGKLDQDVTLTAALVCNSVDGVAVTKEFTVCVKGDPDAQDITELLQAKLDAGLRIPV